MSLIQDLEDLEDTEGLHTMFAAVRGMVMLNDTMLLETMVNEDHVMDVVGALECAQIPPFPPGCHGGQGPNLIQQTGFYYAPYTVLSPWVCNECTRQPCSDTVLPRRVASQGDLQDHVVVDFSHVCTM